MLAWCSAQTLAKKKRGAKAPRSFVAGIGRYFKAVWLVITMPSSSTCISASMLLTR